PSLHDALPISVALCQFTQFRILIYINFYHFLHLLSYDEIILFLTAGLILHPSPLIRRCLLPAMNLYRRFLKHTGITLKTLNIFVFVASFSTSITASHMI